MTSVNQKVENEKELRVVLNVGAAAAYVEMVARMRSLMPTVKVVPSHFVSFLVADFFTAHFERDIPVLIAEFFDSDGFYEAARKKAKGAANYEELMANALAEAKAIKAKKRRRLTPLEKNTNKNEGPTL